MYEEVNKSSYESRRSLAGSGLLVGFASLLGPISGSTKDAAYSNISCPKSVENVDGLLVTERIRLSVELCLVEPFASYVHG